MNRRTALITGKTGQHGSYLAEHLVDAGMALVGREGETARPDRQLAATGTQP